ncbi:SWITCH1 [Raphanus sativus]|uniref:Protein AMEIOTIC 1 homolog n=1 Tax=Raphanus sativus TaxID=3726 RepID=A0A9W3CR19_RAPSA|nr:protein AMEIOTIC 1 homolog [Raphanus sativus]XP_056854021.1 protein AMEIOTIC 1 homolog [Raphanus sativus]KAJ4870649.1 SWITCH1 [Raphanus sativus]
MSGNEIRPIKLKASLAMKKHHEEEDNNSKALVKVKLEKDKHVSSSDDGSSGKAMVTVKLEKEEESSGGVLVASSGGALKRKRISRLVEKSRRFSAKSSESSSSLLDKQKQKTCLRRGMTTRWNTDRIDNAELALFEILKEKGASFERPVPRAELRVSARRRIGDTGLLDHLLKHIDGNVTPGGAERFRRCHNTEGTMQYWLESADLIKIKLESGVCDSNWAPPSWWKLQGANSIIKLEPGVLEPSESPAKLKEEMDKMRSEIKELVSDLALIKRESGIRDLDSIPLAQWKIHSSSKESPAVSSKLREEIDKMKSDLKKHISKPELPNNADANEKLIKDFMSWRVKTDKQIAEISNSLASTQCMVKELVSWKDKVEQQLVGISNSHNSRQANGSNSFSPNPQNWEHLLHSTNLDDFTGDGFEPWDVDTDLIDALPEAEAVRPDTYLLPPNARKSSFQDHMWFEEQSVLNSEMQRTTESCMTRGDSRSSNQDKAELTPGSSMTAGPRSDIEDPNINSQETLKELVSWKAKAEQQLMEISDAVRALQG